MLDRWLLRAVKWARNPPSAKQVRFFLYILAFCIAIYTYEKFFGWPEFLEADRLPRRLR